MRLLLLFLMSVLCGPTASAQWTKSFAELEGLEGRAYIDAANLLPYGLIVSDLTTSERVIGDALRYSESLGYAKGEAESHAWLGVITYLQGRYDLSVMHGQRSIDLYRELGMRSREGHQYTLLGFQMKSRDLPRAIGLMRTGIAMLEAEADSGALTGAYDNYGTLKLAANERDSAVYFYRKALKLKYSLGDSLGIPYSLNKLGTAFLEDGRHDEAKAMLDEAYLIRTMRNDQFGIMENYGYYGDFFHATGQLDSAIHWYQRTVGEGLRQHYPFILRNTYLSLSEVYEAKGDPARALEMHRAHSAVKDSLLNEQRIRQVTELELRFDTAEKERENTALRQQRAEQALTLSRQRGWMLGIAATSFIVLLLGALLFQRHRQRETARRDAAIIAERERSLRAIITATEEERRRIAKDLHDGIVQTLTGIKLRMHSPDTAAILDGAITEVRDISHRMMPRALQELGLVPALDDMLEKSLVAAGIGYSFEKMGLDSGRLPEHVETGLYRIAQELVNNIIKHAKATHVSVQLVRTGERLVLVVEDDGVGLPPDAGDSNGLGLSGMRSRASGMGGEMTLERSPNGGTVAMVRVPLR